MNGKDNFILGWNTNNLKENSINAFHELVKLNKNADYWFGYLGYDLKNSTLPKTNSTNIDIHNFQDVNFFKADNVIIKKNNQYLFYGSIDDFTSLNKKIAFRNNSYSFKKFHNSIELIATTSKNEYLEKIKQIKYHIQNGDTYEMNYCIQFKANNINISELQTFERLINNTKAPFSALLSINEVRVLSASPERFINKCNKNIISQPIKGTAKRGDSMELDQQIIQDLISNEKEISENVMIVDLVRNDMSKIAEKNSVQVPELCKLYTFETVHQLISTVEAKVSKDLNPVDIINALFPMGSMTGAPKIEATKIIDQVENFKRGIYSGSIGFLSPNNSFDFNVVIRSILYNNELKNISISVGSAITIKSIGIQEYEECLLKLKAIVEVLK